MYKSIALLATVGAIQMCQLLVFLPKAMITEALVSFKAVLHGSFVESVEVPYLRQLKLLFDAGQKCHQPHYCALGIT
jgi:hypothetical protein